MQVILPASSGGSSNSGNDAGIQTLSQAGVQVREDAHYYIHGKMMVADGQKAFVGSENFSSASLDKNRELGILLADHTVIATLQQTFQQDWGDSQSGL
ncbi:MAG TPA: phospholipase D-like domain-containing protein [Ktedonobacteraceae bacterium]|nr:phospholipase D-like domain-containing protein [Ktedonobacteraceae bacterium]